ncbi:hypothetical protein G7046_g10021 [Stylonectria norvegica]|nr:hypothetical protein G7046_g10021 [Stylonectria norvegica]
MDNPEAPTTPTTIATPTTPSPQIIRDNSRSSPAINLLAKHAAAAQPRHRAQSPNDDRQSPAPSASHDFYNSAQWTADGTSSSSDLPSKPSPSLSSRMISSTRPSRASLEPQAVTTLPEPTQTIVAAPFYSLAEPATQTFLVGCRDHPIQLYHCFPNDAHLAPLASYKLIRKETEEYITPSSMLWETPGTHFICGSANRLDYFDMSRHGSDGPVLTIPTIPSKRHIAKGSGVGMKGTVSALAASPVDANGGYIIAAGTWTRWVGLYDLHRTNKVVANWAVSNREAIHDWSDVGGQGIMQVVWSPCGRYLVVNERQSSGLLVYDIRGTGKLLNVLKGRDAATQQKLHCDVFQGAGSAFEVWAGSQDGCVAVWEDVGAVEGPLQPTWTWNAHEAPVGSTVVHSSGSVAATCSGGWGPPSMQDIDDGMGTKGGVVTARNVFRESTLKIWSIGAS